MKEENKEWKDEVDAGYSFLKNLKTAIQNAHFLQDNCTLTV